MDLAEAMSRANNSAQMAGSSLDRYIGYLTTITDVTQKSAASVGESMKTIYSRYQNIAAGKFVAAQSDIDSENYNEDEWSNLNDVETALGALGIKIRDSVDNFRNFDDVMAEIASKWNSYSDVQQSGIATALAGTRQRENVITMFENFDLVKKYEQISANSYGTAAQKMEAYTDSVEAARQRITTSVEKFVLSLSTSKLIKKVYNVVADLTEHMYSLAAAITVFLLAINTKSTTQGVLSGVNTIQQKLVNFSMSQIKMGQANYGLLNGGGVVNGQEVNSLRESFNESFLSSQKELFSKTITQTIDSLTSMDEASRTMLKDGMVPLQNSMIELNSAQKKELSTILLRIGDENKEATQRQLSIARLLAAQNSEVMTEAALGMVNDEKKRAILAQLQGVEVTQITEEQLQTALKDRATKEQVAAAIIDQEMPEEARRTLGGNIGASSRMTVGSAVRDSVLSALGMGGGTLLGGSLGSMFGNGGATVGASIGAVIGNVASSTMISQFASGATLKAALSSLGFLWPAIGVLFVGGIIGAIKSSRESIKKEAVQIAKETAEEYTNALNSSAEAINFDKLVNGVDYLGRNVSLTDDEYQKFLDSSNALAEAFPDLVVRVDEFGNKLVGPDGLKGKVGSVTEEIDKMTESMKIDAATDFFKQVGGKYTGDFFGTEDAYGQVFSEQMDVIMKARKKLTGNGMYNKYKGVYTNRKAYGINGEIELRQEDLALIEQNERKESENYKRINEELKTLILQQDTYNDQIKEATVELSSYNEQLIAYASTGLGREEFGEEFSDLYEQFNSLPEEAQTAINQVIGSVQAPSFKNKEDEQSYKKRLLQTTQEATKFFEQNPIAVDLYFGTGEFKTLGEKQKGAEQLIPILQEMFGTYIDPTEKEIIEHLGLKVVIDGDKTSIEVESLGEVFAKNFDGFDEGLVTDNTVQNWDDYIGGLSKEKLSQLKKLQSGGWIGAGSVYTPDILNKMLGNGYEYTGYNAGNVQRLVDRAQDYTSNSNLFDDLEQQWSSTDDYGISDFVTKSKTEIAAAFPELDEATWELIYNLQSEIRKGVAETGGQGAKEIAENAIEQVKEAAKGSWLNDVKEQLAVQAETFFPDVSSIEGAIDTWGELSAAMKNVSETYDTLADATKENNTLGHLSAQTVVDLISENENYATAMDVVDGKIKLNSDAERIMNEIKIETLKASIDAMIAENTAKIEQLKTQYESVAANGTYVESVNDVVDAYNLELQAATELTNELHRQNMEKEGLDSSGYAGREANIVKGRVVAVTDVKTKLSEIDSQIISLEHQNKILSALRGQLDTVTDAKSWGKMYDNLDTTSKKSKDAADSVEKMLKALDSLIDKEWEAMEVWDEYNQKSTGYTAYFDKKRISLEKQAEFYKSQMKNASTEEERLDAEKDYILAQKEINNLDDEEIEDKYNILELQGASLDKLIAMQKVYIQTSDTEEENLERNKKLVELLQQQVELHREVSEWQRDNTDRLIDRLSGDAFGNEAYDRAIGQQIDAVNDELVDTQKLINDNYARAVKNYEQTGHTHAEALRLAYTGNNDYSQALRDEMTKYYDLIDKRTEYTIKKMEDKADDLNRRLDLIEKEKPDEWFKIGDIDSYYTQRMDLLQKQVELYQDALKDTSDMTDEQIQNIVDSLNEATLNLKQAQIDNLKDQTDLQSKQYDAIVYRINLWKDEIQDAIDAIEKAYGDEIKPIQDVSDELERQAKLEDLLAAKKAAAKEKERVALNALYKNGYISQKPEMVETQERLKTIISYFKRKEVKLWRVFIKQLLNAMEKVILDKRESLLKEDKKGIKTLIKKE